MWVKARKTSWRKQNRAWFLNGRDKFSWRRRAGGAHTGLRRGERERSEGCGAERGEWLGVQGYRLRGPSRNRVGIVRTSCAIGGGGCDEVKEKCGCGSQMDLGSNSSSAPSSLWSFWCVLCLPLPPASVSSFVRWKL